MQPITCKLEIGGRIVEQVMEFNYLILKITSSREARKIHWNPSSKSGKMMAL
jgi:hypothetical protein